MNPNKVVCAKMPDALDEVCSEEYMPGIAAETRAAMAEKLLDAEGSSEVTGMTCIAENDYDQLAREFVVMHDRGDFEEYSLPDAVQGRLRGLNRHCDECLRVNCKNRVSLTRAQIRKKSGFGPDYLNSRRAKVKHSKSLPVIRRQKPSGPTITGAAYE